MASLSNNIICGDVVEKGSDLYGKSVENAIGLISAAVDQCTSSMQLDTSPNHRRNIQLDVPLPFIDSSTKSNANFKCKPWDYSLFISRASTFSISNWFAKPQEVGPLQCARYGWINSGPNELECVSCGAHILDKVSKTLDYEGERNASLSLVKRLNETHKDKCPWKNNASPKTFLKFQIKSDQTMFTNVILRKQSIRKLISINNSGSSSSGNHSSKKRKRTVQNNFNLNITNMASFSNNKFLSSCKDSLLLLSFFGWSSSSNSNKESECDTLKCILCNRRLGLSHDIDPLNSHRYFCPIRTSNKMPDGVTMKKGFELIIEAYLRYKEKHSLRNNGNTTSDDNNIVACNTRINLKPEDALRFVKNAFVSTKKKSKVL
jgi:hypothetical protein